jgi:hypothetical protein
MVPSQRRLRPRNPFLPLLLHLLAAVLPLETLRQGCRAFSPPSTSPSPWAPATWLLTLEFGPSRPPSDDDGYVATAPSPAGPGRGRAGSRLVVRGAVVVESTDASERRGNGPPPSAAAVPYDPILGNRKACVIRPVTKEDETTLPSLLSSSSSSSSARHAFSYVNLRGQQKVELSSGGWTIEFPTDKKHRALKVRFYMDLLNDIERNDVMLRAGTRLYFMANGWREGDYEFGRNLLRPLQAQLEEAQRALEGHVSHESGDRRLDGTDVLQTLQAYRDVAQLVADRDEKLRRWREAARHHPASDDLPEGPWPGSTEWLTLSEGSNPIFVLQPKNEAAGAATATTAPGWKSLLAPWGNGPDSYSIVGTWTAQAIVADDDVVWQDDD